MTDEIKNFQITNKPTLIVILDGWPKSVFEEMLDAGELYDLSEYVIKKGGVIPNVVSNLPSVSLASHTSILTSQYVDEHCIPGHRWLDRKEEKIHTYFSLNGAKKANADISEKSPIIFTATSSIKAISIQSIITKGAKKKYYLPNMSGNVLLKKTTQVLVTNPNATVVTWLPKVDSLSHSYGPYSTNVRKEMKQTSVAFGKMAKKLIEQNIYDDLRILLIPDHGQRMVKKSVKLEVLFKKIGLLNTVVNPRSYSRKNQIILTGGDSSAQVYLTDDQIDSKLEISKGLCAFPEIEIAAWPEGDFWHFINRNGHSCVKRCSLNLVEYKICEGNDPLGLLEHDTSAEFDLSTPQITYGKYPDFLHQIMHSYVKGRSGDIFVFPSETYHFGRAPRIGFRLGFHRGSHGGPTKGEVIVSALFKGLDISVDCIRAADLLRVLGLI